MLLDKGLLQFLIDNGSSLGSSSTKNIVDCGECVGWIVIGVMCVLVVALWMLVRVSLGHQACTCGACSMVRHCP